MAIYALEDRILFDAAGPGDSDSPGDSTPDGDNAPIESEPTPEQKSESEKQTPAEPSESTSDSDTTSEQEQKQTSEKDSSAEESGKQSKDSSDTDIASTDEGNDSDSEQSTESADQQESAAETESSAPDSSADDKQLSVDDQEEEQKKEIAFVSDSLTDKETIIEALEEEEVEVVVVAATDSGLDVINETLKGRQEVDAVHIFSHGGDGHFSLGTDVVDAGSLETNKELFQGWSQSLTEDGDINLYGCKIAESDSGKTFINKLARLTQADVAASTDDTGSPSTGGDWDLEYTSGPVNSNLDFGTTRTASLLASYTVDTLDDVVNPLDGVLSLREAIIAANLTVGINDDINFTGLSGTINLDPLLGQLLITDSLTINGAGDITIDAGGNSRIFNINDISLTHPYGDHSTNINVTLTGLTLQNGNSTTELINQSGGAVYSRENLTINNSTISGNTAGDSGGGVYSKTYSGSTEINNSTFSGNQADGRGGGLLVYTGDGGQISIEQSTFSGNEADLGGGIFTGTSGSVATAISNSTISGNTATSNGGGLFLSSLNNNPATISSTIIADNSAGGTGNDLLNDQNSQLDVTYSLIETTDGHQVDNDTNTGTGADSDNVIGFDPLLAPWLTTADRPGPTRC